MDNLFNIELDYNDLMRINHALSLAIQFEYKQEEKEELHKIRYCIEAQTYMEFLSKQKQSEEDQ